MVKSLSHYRRRVTEKGVRGIISSRFDLWRLNLTINNRTVGRAIELAGNRVRMDGLTYSVDSPRIPTAHKCTIAFGYHEPEERLLVKRWLPSNVPLLELGGGLGTVACLANKKLSDPVRHVVVEADPELIPLLERNRDLNYCKFTIVNKALAYDCDHVELSLHPGFVCSNIFGSGERTSRVQATTISDLLNEAGFSEAGIICDIEGGESHMIKRELPRLRGRIKFLLLELHAEILGECAIGELLQIVSDLGFVLKQRTGKNVFLAAC